MSPKIVQKLNINVEIKKKQPNKVFLSNWFIINHFLKIILKSS